MQVASCRQAIRDMDKLVALKAKGVYWGENEPNSTKDDAYAAQRYRDELIRKLLLAANLGANYILDWERALCYLAAWKLADPAKTLAYIRKCAGMAKAQYDVTIPFMGQTPDGVGRLNWDHVLGKTDEEIVNWMCQSIIFEPEAAHGRDTSYPKTPGCVINKVYGLKRWVDDQKPKTLDSALTAFDLAAPSPPKPQPGKKRSHAKKQPLPATPTHQPVSDPNPAVTFDQAVEALTLHYVGRCQAAGLDPSGIGLIFVGPIYYTKGVFRYDTAYNKIGVHPTDPVPLDQLTNDQALAFQGHLGTFEQHFKQYLDDNSRFKAQATLTKGIMDFLHARVV